MGLQSTCLAVQGCTIWVGRKGTKEKIVKDTSSPISSWGRGFSSFTAGNSLCSLPPVLNLHCLQLSLHRKLDDMAISLHCRFLLCIYLSQMMHSYEQGKQGSTNLLFLRGARAWLQMATHCTEQRSDNAEQQERYTATEMIKRTETKLSFSSSSQSDCLKDSVLLL